MSDPGVGRTRQSAIYRDGVFGKRPTVPTDAGALEARAQAAMSSTAWAYVAAEPARERRCGPTGRPSTAGR